MLLVLSAMRHFARALAARGVRVDHVRLDEEGALLLSLGVKGQGQQGPLHTIQWTDQTIRRKERRMNTCLLLLEDDGAELEHRGRHVGVVVVHGLGPVVD